MGVAEILWVRCMWSKVFSDTEKLPMDVGVDLTKVNIRFGVIGGNG